MTDSHGALEQRDRATREAALLAALPGHITRAQQAASAFAASLAGADAAAITRRQKLAHLPARRQAELPGACPTGRSNSRVRGWPGRADQTTKLRGIFVHPRQVAEVLLAAPGSLPNDGKVIDDGRTDSCMRRG